MKKATKKSAKSGRCAKINNVKTTKTTKNDYYTSKVNEIMMNMGFTLDEIEKAREEIKNRKTIRTYVHDYDNNVIRGCLLATKDNRGRVRFGFSAVHTFDAPTSKKICGEIAALTSVLKPNRPLPMMFYRYGIINPQFVMKSYNCGNTRFINRCFNYFNVNKIVISQIIGRENNKVKIDNYVATPDSMEV